MEQTAISGNGYGNRPVWQWVIIYAFIAAIVYGLVYYLVLSKGNGYTPTPSQEYAPTAQQTPQQQTPEQVSSLTGQPADLNQPPANTQNTVTYTDSGFSPSTLTIKKGETATFKNMTPGNMWVASSPHPAHTDYPEFDAKREVAPGETYQFTFAKTGNWKYHNHVNLGKYGTIVVQ